MMVNIMEVEDKGLEFREVLEKVYRERGFDFRQYKEASLRRRMQKRLYALKAESYQDYIMRLDADSLEYDRLIDVLLINVTEFFRDEEAFEIIKNKVLPYIIKGKTKLKIGSSGCASGEEVYSIAILLDEALGDKRDSFEISIYGTDIDRDSLTKAKEGIYRPQTVKGKMTDEILEKYFDKGETLKVKDSIKKNCHFMVHDLVLDKPLSEMDLILCRNVLIYFEKPLQEKIYMDFYHALNSEGYLFLGKAESLIGPARERFSVIDKRWKIYQKED
ncbi:MAG: protein-glutamate O-methyltransferase CheR [Chlamydiae bacterium]|nr:protein-glutamate O-methyltransferase CheR [Chlamydiota bacterium]MBI3277893.1 protein-glutamate O-methyltransferase CheR [Chlamydiota bacterium]